ncbi:uncharacterized protein LOC129788765 [Lutzomyia longipalpis]|uniref:uncharacterized protein LOC129788765 n=1 Tax=Lutzomyia longipalpis TaxID=7200 RepID=UPI0024839242|nr:uncharacterized protein LOC129788765 [Lutzomyia longipalpis]XP_055681073.1 uncharacterized protein LOC129788765 [Lutzomyia longipalpis]
MAANGSILMLNDDCLLHLFSFFTLKELLVIDRVCERFNNVAQRIYRTYQVMDFDQIFRKDSIRLTKEDVVEISRRIGPHIHTFRASRVCFAKSILDVCEFPFEAIEFCSDKKLQNIYFCGFIFISISKEQMKILSRAFSSLKTAHLQNCTVTDNFESCFVDSSQLEVLNLIESNPFTGQHLAKLTTITELNLCYSEPINPQFFIKFCQRNPQVRKLTIRGCNTLNENCLRAIVSNFRKLEELSICNSLSVCLLDYAILADIVSLKVLQINYELFENSFTVQMLVMKIAQHETLEHLELLRCNSDEAVLNDLVGNFKKLKVLKLCHSWHCRDSTLASISCTDTLEELHITHCRSITPSALKVLITKCKSLRLIDLSHCYRFDFNFLVSIEPHLWNRQQVLELVVNCTNISIDLKDSSKNDLKEFLVNNEGRIKLTTTVNDKTWTEMDRYIVEENEDDEND